MQQRNLLRRINTVFLASLSFAIAFTSSIAYAQQNPVVSSNSGSDSLLWFSLVLFIFIPLLIVLVLFLNRKMGQQSELDKQVQFETERLYFAAVVLTGLALVFLESMAMYYWAPIGSEGGKEIFDTCKTVIPPIVTLVIGYYFGKTEQRQQAESNKQARNEEES